MENPAHEIVGVVKLITTATTPAIQKAAIQRFFTSDAGFQHPLCTVPSAPGSRDSVLSIYQWYRNLSPHITLDVESFVYDAENARVYLNIVQEFHIFVSPFKPSPSRLLVRLTLRKEENERFCISQQEDFYQPEDILHLIFPPLVRPISLIKRAAALACSFNTAVFQFFGFWSPGPPVHKRDI